MRSTGNRSWILASIAIAWTGTLGAAPAMSQQPQPQPAEGNAIVLEPADKLKHLYSSYEFEPYAGNGGAFVKLFSDNQLVANFDIVAQTGQDTDTISIIAATAAGNTTLTLSRDKLDLTFSIDGTVIGEAQAVKSMKDGTLVFDDMAFYFDLVETTNVDALALVGPALSDPALQSLFAQTATANLTQAIFGPVTPVACTAGECNNLYPGQGPFDQSRNCICQCCIDEGGCFSYIDTFYGGDIGCSGTGWVGQLAFVACSGICIPFGPLL
ncbi:MAG: hypothetical protein ACTS3F_14190 [Phycisphaerales bacterium]